MQRARKLDPVKIGTGAEELKMNLRHRVVGQDEAVDAVIKIYQACLAGMTPPGHPIGNFLFLGPTGSGKTRMAEALAESLFGNPKAMTKIDCAEFQHSHEISKLIGSPPGYLGHRETPPFLTQGKLEQHHTDRLKMSVVLFDEIEKASDALWDLLLGILDKATLTLGSSEEVDFSRCVIFMTSNVGSKEMWNFLSPPLGFATGMSASSDRTCKKLADAGLEAARSKFSPEFMNRIDRTVVFHPLTDIQFREILDLELGYVHDRIYASQSGHIFYFRCTVEAKSFLLEEGTDPRYGARDLKRAIERYIVHPLSNLIATEQIGAGEVVHIDFDKGSRCLLFCSVEAEESSLPMVSAQPAEAASSGMSLAASASIARRASITRDEGKPR